MSSEKFYITTPIYYVNDKPHIGHAYTTILADILTRYARLLGRPSFFLTGTDEHGQKVQQAADANGITPKEQCDQTVVRFKELWERLKISHNRFIRTTEPEHMKAVQGVLQDLFDRDLIYKADYTGYYDVRSERFFTEKDLLEGNRSPESGDVCQEIVESNYFFRMSQYQDWLISYINDNPKFIQPDHRRNETLGFLKQPLEDLCISRPKSRLSWGIELPFDTDYVCYVWFDALLNYVTGVGYGTDEKTFNSWWPANYHLIGKDILTTHTVYWPTMLKAMDVPMPETIFAHGWWLTGRDKMSKSAGNVVNPMEMVDKYGVDAFKYFLMAEMPLGQDASFTEEGFIARYNTDLANDLGNMLNRVNKLMFKYCDGKVPENTLADGEHETELKKITMQAVKEMTESIDGMRLDQGLASVINAVRAANRYMELRAPWKLGKEGKLDEVQQVLRTAAEALRIISALLYPVIQEKMVEMRGALGVDAKKIEPKLSELEHWEDLSPGSALQAIESLFPRIDAESLNKSEQTGPEDNVGTLIDFDSFGKVELKTAKVVEAEPVEKADKLLKLQLEVGEEKRQIVAGIAKFYSPEQLVGKTIVIVANLQPAKIRGVESQGMLLAASKGEDLRLVTIDGDLPSGAEIG